MYLPIVISAAAFLFSIFSFFYLKSYLKQRTSHERIPAEVRKEVDITLREINETTFRDISLLDERERSLKSLLDEIDKRLRAYLGEIEKRRSTGETYAALSQKALDKEAREGKASEAAGNSASMAASYQELGKKRYRPAAHEAAGETEAAFPIADFEVKNESAPDAPPLGEQVRSLVRAGFAQAVIASRLGISIAEVELIAALMERRENPTAGT